MMRLPVSLLLYFLVLFVIRLYTEGYSRPAVCVFFALQTYLQGLFPLKVPARAYFI